MQHDVDHRPSFALLTVRLDEGESIRAEAGAMVSYSDGIEVETAASGGTFGSIERNLLGGESAVQNTFRATRAGHVTLAPPLPGDVVRTDLDDGTLYIQSGSCLASDPAIGLDASFGGAKTFFGSEGLFLLEATAPGRSFSPVTARSGRSNSARENATPWTRDTSSPSSRRPTSRSTASAD